MSNFALTVIYTFLPLRDRRCCMLMVCREWHRLCVDKLQKGDNALVLRAVQLCNVPSLDLLHAANTFSFRTHGHVQCWGTFRDSKRLDFVPDDAFFRYYLRYQVMKLVKWRDNLGVENLCKNASFIGLQVVMMSPGNTCVYRHGKCIHDWENWITLNEIAIRTADNPPANYFGPARSS